MCAGCRGVGGGLFILITFLSGTSGNFQAASNGAHPLMGPWGTPRGHPESIGAPPPMGPWGHPPGSPCIHWGPSPNGTMGALPGATLHPLGPVPVS